MASNERDIASLWDMAQAIREILEDTAGLSVTALDENRVLRLAVERNFEILGEAARRISNEFREEHPTVDWRGIIGLRNILAHRYESVDYDVLWELIELILPDLLVTLEGWLPPIED